MTNEKKEKSGSTGKMALGAAIGAAAGLVAGAAAGILFAPKSGKETRKIIGKKAKELTDKSKELVEKGKEMVESGVEIAKESTGKTIKNISKKLK